MQGLAALCHTARKGGYIGSRSTYTWRASSPLDKISSDPTRGAKNGDLRHSSRGTGERSLDRGPPRPDQDWVRFARSP